MQPGAGALAAAAVQQQTIGGDQQHLEEYEQIEQVAGQEGAVQAEQLQLEQHLEVASGVIGAAHRINTTLAASTR